MYSTAQPSSVYKQPTDEPVNRLAAIVTSPAPKMVENARAILRARRHSCSSIRFQDLSPNKDVYQRLVEIRQMYSDVNELVSPRDIESQAARAILYRVRQHLHPPKKPGYKPSKKWSKGVQRRIERYRRLMQDTWLRGVTDADHVLAVLIHKLVVENSAAWINGGRVSFQERMRSLQQGYHTTV